MVGDAQTVRFLVTRYNSVCINNEIFLYYILVYTIEVIAAVRQCMLMKRPPVCTRVFGGPRRLGPLIMPTDAPSRQK